MGMMGGAIGAGIGILGSVAGAIGSSRRMKKARGVLQEQQRENQAWFDKEYNRDYTQRADAQALLERVRQQADNQYKRAEQMAAVTGATGESLAMQKAAANDMYAQTLTGLGEQASRFKEGVMNRFLDTRSQLNGRQYDSYVQGAQQWQQTAANAGQMASGIGGLFQDKEGGK